MSPAVAVRLGKLFGDGAGVWIRMQAAYDTWNAERQEDVSKIPTLRVTAASDFAVGSRLGHTPPGRGLASTD